MRHVRQKAGLDPGPANAHSDHPSCPDSLLTCVNAIIFIPRNLRELPIWKDYMYGQGRELEIGNATSAVLISLLQTLVDKGVVSNTEVRALLTKAASDLGPHDYTAPVKGAIGVILDDILPKFPENGGD